MSDWSSFKNNKKHSDAWKSFLTEGTFISENQEDPLDEFTGGLKNFLRGKSGGKHNLSRDKNKYTDDLVCKKGEKCGGIGGDGEQSETETYNADDVVALNKAFDDINRLLGLKIDRAALSDELQALLTDPQGNNYTIEEQAIHKASVILGRMPILGDLSKYPNLTKLFNGALTNAKTKAHLHKILARGGFFGKEGDQIPDWFEKAPEPAAGPQKEAPEGVVGDCKKFKVNKSPANPLMALQMYLLNVRKEYQLNPEKYALLRDYIVKQSVAAGFFSELDAKEIKEVVGQVAPTKTPQRQARPVKGSNSKAAKSRSVDLSGIFQIFTDQEVAQSIYDCCKLQLKTSGWNIGQPAAAEEEPAPEEVTPVDVEEIPDEEQSRNLARVQATAIAAFADPSIRNLEDYATVYEYAQSRLKPDGNTWELLMGELEKGLMTPEEISTGISAFGEARDENNQTAHQIKFIELATAQLQDKPDNPDDANDDKPEEKKVFYLADDFDTNKIKGSWNSVNKRKAGPNINFQSDLDAFVNFIGPYLPEHILSEKKTSNDPVEKIANSNYLIKNKEKILQQFKKLSRKDPKKAEKVTRMSRVFMKSQSKNLLSDLMRKVRTKMVSDQGGEVAAAPTKKQPASASDIAGLAKSYQDKMAEEKLNESNTIGRWKSLAGIK